MTSAPTLKCKIDISGNVKAALSSNENISATFSIPTQVEAEKFYGSYEYTPSNSKQSS